MEIKKDSARLWSRLGPRVVFGWALSELAREKRDFYVVTADVAATAGLSRFASQFPDQFVNVGIAEQNMVGMAAGLAEDGTPVFCASYAPFTTMRACEQIRIHMGYMQMNVKAVGFSAGLVMGHFGNCHYGIEDISIVRGIPGITIVSPADGVEIVKAVQAAVDFQGPIYLRLTGNLGLPVVYSEDFDFQIGKANILRRGSEVAIIAAGTMVHTALEAAKRLEDRGIGCTVVDMHTIKPLDTDCINEMLGYRLIVTLEEHTVSGGLGGTVAEYLAGIREKPPQLILGIPDCFPRVGDYPFLLDQCGLTVENITERILEIWTQYGP